MTRDELKAMIDDLLGIESQGKEASCNEEELHYFSPTGVLLFAITVFQTRQGEWLIGGYPGGTLPNMWQTLMRLQRAPPSEKEVYNGK